MRKAFPLVVASLLAPLLAHAAVIPPERVVRFDAPRFVFLNDSFEIEATVEGMPYADDEELAVYVQDPKSGYFGMLTNDGVTLNNKLTFTVDSKFFPRGEVRFGIAIVRGEGCVLALPPEAIEFTRTVRFLSVY